MSTSIPPGLLGTLGILNAQNNTIAASILGKKMAETSAQFGALDSAFKASELGAKLRAIQFVGQGNTKALAKMFPARVGLDRKLLQDTNFGHLTIRQLGSTETPLQAYFRGAAAHASLLDGFADTPKLIDMLTRPRSPVARDVATHQAATDGSPAIPVAAPVAPLVDVAKAFDLFDAGVLATFGFEVASWMATASSRTLAENIYGLWLITVALTVIIAIHHIVSDDTPPG